MPPEMTAAPAAPRLAEWLSHTAAAIPLSIGDMLRKSAALWPEQEAVVFSHQPLIAEVRWTFAALDRQATLLAERLLAFGYQPGDRIAILGPNHPEWILLEYALAKTHAVGHHGQRWEPLHVDCKKDDQERSKQFHYASSRRMMLSAPPALNHSIWFAL